MMSFFTWLGSFLSGPIIAGLEKAYTAKLAAQNTTGAQALDLAKTAVLAEVSSRQAANQIIMAEQGRWYTALPRILVEFSFAAYIAKCVVWDTMLGWGSTPAIKGDLAVWAGWLMAIWFGGSSIRQTALAIWTRR